MVHFLIANDIGLPDLNFYNDNKQVKSLLSIL